MIQTNQQYIDEQSAVQAKQFAEDRAYGSSIGRLAGPLIEPRGLRAQTGQTEPLAERASRVAIRLADINRGLALLRAKLFGEAEVSKDLTPQSAPMPSLQMVIHDADGASEEACSQLESILKRL